MTQTDAAHAGPGSALTSYGLEDRYRADSGRVVMSSIQALARLPIEQLRRDRAAGHNTAAFLSGYPGSPLGGYDLEVARMLAKHGRDLPVVHRPGVNEELAASAVMGSQLAAGRPDAVYDGVLGIWYGKAPGLDRASDAIRHGVFAGTSPLGGVVALVGDDPAAKSSTMPSSSDSALVDLHMPVLYPGTPSECLELGLHAIAISRACGLWSSMKIVTPVADGIGTVDLPVLASDPVMPEGWDQVTRTPSAMFLGSARMVAAEKEFRTVRADLAYRYGVANRLNAITVDPADAWIGLVSTGFTYYEMREALARIGLRTDDDLASAGIRLLQLRMPVPFDRDLVRRFARGLAEIVVVEEKNPTLERAIKDALYDTAERPRIVGKHDETGAELIHEYGLLDADAIVAALHARISRRVSPERLIDPTPPTPTRELLPLVAQRAPYFCSGCPHNWGTKVPEGTLVGSGTGCHGMTLLMDPDTVGETFGITAMGSEGAHWIGMEPFVGTTHVVQNLGDGTYFHSAQLAVQAAIGAGVDMTFKLLINDTVAMTGGQDASFTMGVPQVATSLLAQGAAKVVVTVPDVKAYDASGLPKGVAVRDREDILDVQIELAAIPGVTVLIHHSPCAAELRRARKRGKAATPPVRIAINPRICEGCGDCGAVSNCLSVQPVETPLGRRTRIDQDSCNIDLSCAKGDCPAFLEVTLDPDADEPRLVRPTPPSVPDPVPAPTGDVVSIRLAGIGGTGVVTTAQVLGTAAMFDGYDVAGLDQTGLSQKAGPVISDVVLSRGGAISSNHVGAGGATVLLALDELVGSGDDVLASCDPSSTRVVASTTRTPTGRMVADPRLPYPSADVITDRFRAASTSLLQVDAGEVATALVGDEAQTNVLLLGVAVQSGALPVSVTALERALELNGVAVEANLAAFGWGRALAHDPEPVLAAARAAGGVAADMMTVPTLPTPLADRVTALGLSGRVTDVLLMLAADLVGHSDAGWSGQWLGVVERVVAAEAPLGSEALTETAARGLHKVMAYKDEYEVARLMHLPEARAAVAETGGGTAAALLHPPTLSALGRRHKIKFGPSTRPVFTALARAKKLRGTPLDPFGRTELRRTERELVGEYVRLLVRLVGGLSEATHDEAVRIAGLVDAVRGYESLKMRRVAEYRAAADEALAAYPG